MQALPHSVPPTLKQDTANPCLHRRLLDTHWHVWVSFLWGHCSFLLGPCAHKVLFVPSKRAYAIPRSAAPRAPAAGHWWPVPLQETFRHSSNNKSKYTLSVYDTRCSLWVVFLISNSHPPWNNQVPILQMRRLRHRELNDQYQVTQQIFNSGLFDIMLILPYTASIFIETNLTNSG